MEGKKVDQKKKNEIRRRYCIVCMIIAFASATVMWELYNYKIWNEHTQVVKQIILVGGLYTFAYWFFVKMYQGHKIGVYRLTELAYFQLLSYGMADAFMVLASMFWFRKISIKFIVIALIMLVAQIGINGVCIFISNRAWMQYDEPQKIVFSMV